MPTEPDQEAFPYYAGEFNSATGLTMAGLLATGTEASNAHLAGHAVRAADALIEALNEPKEKP